MTKTKQMLKSEKNFINVTLKQNSRKTTKILIIYNKNKYL